MSGMLMFSRSRSRSLSSMDSRTSRSVCIRSLVISLPRSTFSPSVQRQNWGNGARVTLAPAWDSRRAHLSPHCSSHCREAQEAGLGGAGRAHTTPFPVWCPLARTSGRSVPPQQALGAHLVPGGGNEVEAVFLHVIHDGEGQLQDILRGQCRD